jgi:hypothetical protein
MTRRWRDRLEPLVGRLLAWLLVVAALALALTGRAGGVAMGLVFLALALSLHRLSALERRLERLQALLAVLALRGNVTIGPEDDQQRPEVSSPRVEGSRR